FRRTSANIRTSFRTDLKAGTRLWLRSGSTWRIRRSRSRIQPSAGITKRSIPQRFLTFFLKGWNGVSLNQLPWVDGRLANSARACLGIRSLFRCAGKAACRSPTDFKDSVLYPIRKGATNLAVSWKPTGQSAAADIVPHAIQTGKFEDTF